MTQDTDDAGETNLAEPSRPSLCVELSMDPDDPDQQLHIRYMDRGLRDLHPRNPEYWDQVVDLR